MNKHKEERNCGNCRYWKWIGVNGYGDMCYNMKSPITTEANSNTVCDLHKYRNNNKNNYNFRDSNKVTKEKVIQCLDIINNFINEEVK